MEPSAPHRMAGRQAVPSLKLMYVLQELRDRLRRWFGQGKLKNAKVRRAALGGLFFALLFLILAGQAAMQRLDVKPGDVAPRDLPAPYRIENRKATQAKREAAMAAVPVQQKVDPAVEEQALEYVAYVFDQVESVRALPNTDRATKLEMLREALADLGPAIPDETYASLLSVSQSTLDAARRDAENLVELALSGRVAKEDIADLRAQIDNEVGGFKPETRDLWLRTLIKELVKSRIRSNLVDDPEATQRLRELAAESVEPVVWEESELIIEQGKPITQEQYDALVELRLVGEEANDRALVGTALMSLALIAVMALYLIRFRPDILENDRKLLLLGLIGLLTVGLSLLMKVFEASLGSGVGFLMPIAVNAMLVTILLDAQTALIQSVIVSLIAGMSMGVDQLSHVLVGIAGSTVGVYAVARVESRTDIYRAGLYVSLANFVTVLAVHLMQATPLLNWYLWLDVGLGVANGLIVALFVTGLLPLFENLFGVVTSLKLLELSNPNHPLLKKLLVEAPGSYHHTILVANLCEAAAEAIGADQVLARVGAYYHDIGKTKRPYFFVENQFGGENPHEKLPPSLSAMIITSHVKDGLEMAREARLPQEIIDFIPEHHGTTLVSYFYHKASQNGQAEYVLEEDFRYEGPKPRSKETAICMLADGCEASVRALRQRGHLTVDQIEEQVKKIIDDRLSQGQLDNCDLTLRELDVIAKTFVKVLSGVHHARIEYPPEAAGAKLPAQEQPATDGTGEDEAADADLDQQRAGEDQPDGGAGEPGAPGGGEGAEPDGEGPRPRR